MAESALKKLADPERAKQLARYFKTGSGQYGEGDRFYGIRVPDIRKTARQFQELQLEEIESLLQSPMHETRLLSLLMLLDRYRVGGESIKKQIFLFYKTHTKRINNWDLVDISAPGIIGVHIFEKDRSLLFTLAKSSNVWERRIAVIATMYFISKNDLEDTFTICEKLLTDTHDLMHKACGWALREAGKKDIKRLESFLETHIKRMPRTMLRYAIEKFPEKKRKAYLKR